MLLQTVHVNFVNVVVVLDSLTGTAIRELPQEVDTQVERIRLVD